DRLRLRQSGERGRRRHIRKQSQQRRIGHDVLLFCLTVVTIRLQRDRGAHQIIENSGAAANYGLRLALWIQPRCPCKRKPGRKHKLAVELGLVLITKSEAQSKVRPHPPIVLDEWADVPLLYFGERIAARDD